MIGLEIMRTLRNLTQRSSLRDLGSNCCLELKKIQLIRLPRLHRQIAYLVELNLVRKKWEMNHQRIKYSL